DPDASDIPVVQDYSLYDERTKGRRLHLAQRVHTLQGIHASPTPQTPQSSGSFWAHESLELADARAIFRAWALGDVLTVGLPATGAIHRTLLLTTTSGPYVVRGYRHQERAPVEREHALIAQMRALGIPAPGPIAMPDGETILDYHGAFYALFPHAPGTHVLRTQLSVRGAATMGAFLGRLHRALATVPLDESRFRTLAVDTREAIQEAIALETLMRAHPLRDEVDRRAFARLRSQRYWLEQRTPDDIARAEGVRKALLSLPVQLIHGDYQDTNLLFADASERVISAILDWDPAYIAPRVFEVIRTLDIVFNLEPGRCQAFVAAYRASYRASYRAGASDVFACPSGIAQASSRRWSRPSRGWAPWELASRQAPTPQMSATPIHLARAIPGLAGVSDSLPLDELDLAAAVYSWTRAHGFWIYWEVYQHGNDRARRFIGPAQFIPFLERWRAMRHFLRLF
ncbi:MAG TPA: phosphotransferase, partial [Ktedonobacterales bacterium]|nr:phosphotransferase [Ktedonobacterales bacterium]